MGRRFARGKEKEDEGRREEADKRESNGTRHRPNPQLSLRLSQANSSFFPKISLFNFFLVFLGQVPRPYDQQSQHAYLSFLVLGLFCLLIQFMTARCDIVGGSFLYSRVKHIYVCLLDHTSCPAIFVTTIGNGIWN